MIKGTRKDTPSSPITPVIKLSATALIILACAQMTPAAFVHEGRPVEPHDLWMAWNFEPGVVLLLAFSCVIYFRGARAIWRRAGIDLVVRWFEAASFAAGWLAIFVALVTPLDRIGSALFSAHMLQHEVLILIAAPLLVLGRPMAAFLWAMPLTWRRRFIRIGAYDRLRRFWLLITTPLVAWLIQALVLWLWHLPALFQATLDSEPVHTAQHVSFLISALLFCEALIFSDGKRMGYGTAVIYVFTTAVHTSVLGALLTFATSVWYPVYQERTAAWGLTPLEDQQLGGLIMWVPAGLVYVIAGLALLVAWIRESERKAAQGLEAFLLDAELWRSREWQINNQEQVPNSNSSPSVL
jgi:putative membrane protein